jgi:hypothetical protein
MLYLILYYNFLQFTSIVLFDIVFLAKTPYVAMTSLKLSPSTNNLNFVLPPKLSLCTTTLEIDGRPLKYRKIFSSYFYTFDNIFIIYY